MNYIITTENGDELARSEKLKIAKIFSQHLTNVGIENKMVAEFEEKATLTFTKNETRITDVFGGSLIVERYQTRDQTERVSILFDNENDECQAWFEEKDAFFDFTLDDFIHFVDVIKEGEVKNVY